MKSSFITAILFITSISTTAEAAISRLPYFHAITTTNGLPSNRVRCVHKDSTGFIWIGTDHGIARYDGNHIKNYSSTSSLNINSIEAVSNRLLIATSDGLKLFSPSLNTIEAISFRTFQLFHSELFGFKLLYS